jgi:hypothetical protein
MATAKKEEKKAIMGCASSRHITKLKQSIFAFRYLWDIRIGAYSISITILCKLGCPTRDCTIEQRAFKKVNHCLNTNIYSYLETSGGKSFNLYLNVVHYSTPVIIRRLWQLKTVVFLHWCLLCTVLLNRT